MKKIVLFCDNEKISEQIKIERNITIITTGIVTKKYENNDEVKHFSDFIVKYKNPNYFSTLYDLQKIVEKDMVGDKSVKELLSYNGISLWYFLEYYIFYERNPNFETNVSAYSRVTYILDVLNNFNKKHKPEKVFLQNSDELFYRIAIEYFKVKGIKVELLGISTEKNKLYTAVRNSNFLVSQYLRLRILLRILLRPFIKSNGEKADVILIANERFCKNDKYANANFGSLMREFEKKNLNTKVVEFDQLYIHKSIVKLFKHIKTNKSAFIGSYYTFGSLYESFKIRRFLKKKWSILRNNQKFKQSFEYHGVDIYPFLHSRLNFAFKVFSIFVGDVLSVSKQLVQVEKPKYAVIEHDENYYGKGVLCQRKHNDSFRVASLQTELLYPSGCLARHIKSKDSMNINSDSWRPLPDIKFVSGSYGKSVLVDYCNFSEKIINVAGSPAYDLVVKKIKSVKKVSKSKFGFPNNEKLIVFAGGGVLQDSEVLPELINAVEEQKKCNLIIKAHPLADVSLLNKIVENSGSKKVKILLDANLTELFLVSDLVVSIHSTVVIDAMVLKKPIYLINVINSPMPFEKYGVAHVVHSINEIRGGLIKAMDDKEVYNNSLKGSKRFLEDYLYKLDGKASERIVEKLLESKL